MKKQASTYRSNFWYGTSRIQSIVVLFVLLLCTALQSQAQQQVIPLSSNANDRRSVAIDNVLLTECGPDELGFTMSFALLGGTLPRQERVFIIPQLILDEQTSYFPAIEILGSWAYYHHIRTPQDTPNVPDTLQYRDREALNYQVYQQKVPRQEWMNIALLRLLVVRTNGCGGELYREERVLRVPTPIITDKNKDKVARTENVHKLRGRAFVTFRVNGTEVDPNYLNNRKELERLSRTIDSVASDSTIQILRIQVKGYASPEGPYDKNDRLARERTSSLTRYVIENTKVAPVLFHTGYEAEDWQGLRNFVDTTSMLVHRDELLHMIDSEMDPDEKLHKIGVTWTEDFKVLAREAFPLLRHTDYQIDYQLKEVKEEALEAKLDTTYLLVTDTLTQTLACISKRFKSYKPLLAVKTNMLYDLALAPNIEVEVPFGRNRRWSVMAEYLNPWWRLDKLNYSYEIQEAGLELRRWMAPRCNGSRPCLSGLFAGLYGASAKYDLEYDGTGDQGEMWGVGVTMGYSWPIGPHWNLELSGSAGFLDGKRRHYNAEFESTHLIYKETKKLQYLGPTKFKFSLVWIIPSKKKTI